MPPYQVDADSSHRDDWHRPYDDDKLSPLFRDQNIPIAPSSPSRRLDTRQSDPEYAAAIESGRERAMSSDDSCLRRSPSSSTTTTTAAVVSTMPPVSRITAIIGPESAYVKIPDGVIGAPPPPPLASDDIPGETKRVAIRKSTGVDGGGGETKSTLVRATRFVGKRGRKLVKYIPIRLATAFGTTAVGQNQNAV